MLIIFGESWDAWQRYVDPNAVNTFHKQIKTSKKAAKAADEQGQHFQSEVRSLKAQK